MPQILLHKVIIAKDVEDAEQTLLNLAGLRRYLGGLRTESEKKDFRNHLRKYINLYLPDCPFEVSTTNRYTITAQEAAVTARKRIREGDKIKYLCGTLVPLSDAELQDLDLTQRNFSIVQSDRKKNTLIFLGPARFANHDCAANGRLVSVGKDGLEVHATRNIDIGEEITVTYSPGYFGANNEECLCHTCELQARNGWTSTDAFGAPQSDESTPMPGDLLSDSPYAFRKKRKHGIDIDLTRNGQSSSSPKKRKIGRPTSRLNQVLTPPPSSRSVAERCSPLIAYSNETCDSSTLTEDSQPKTNHGRVNKDVADRVPSDLLNARVGVDLLTQRRLRLVNQMSSMAGSSPEVLTPYHAPPSVSDDSGNDSLSCRDSSHSTQASSISEAPAVTIKVESSGNLNAEKDDEGLCDIRRSSLTSVKPPGSCGPDSAKSDFTSRHPDLTTNPSSIIPSIETPQGDANSPAIASTLAVLPDPTSSSTIRTPGDYILTRRLIAQPFDRWVQCQTCADYFLQSNGYQTRRECPRCERHSMLYGFGWPKTEPDARKLREIREMKEKEEKGVGKSVGRPKAKRWSDSGDTIVVESPGAVTLRFGRRCKEPKVSGGVWGRGGKGGGRSGRSGKGSWVEGGGEDEREERVMDHRTVNRFIAPEEEREVRRRGKNSLLDIANRVSRSGSVVKNGTTPDRMLLARLKASVFVERDGSANASAREESAGSGEFEDGDGSLRRSKRYFGSRMAI